MLRNDTVHRTPLLRWCDRHVFVYVCVCVEHTRSIAQSQYQCQIKSFQGCVGVARGVCAATSSWLMAVRVLCECSTLLQQHTSAFFRAYRRRDQHNSILVHGRIVYADDSQMNRAQMKEHSDSLLHQIHARNHTDTTVRLS